MKGMVFTEFFALVESAFGADMVDDIIDDAKVLNGGAYTSVGTYDHTELVAMVVALSRRTGSPVPELVRTFGTYLFDRFSKNYPRFFNNINDSFEFLMGIDKIIHAEVLKLYPDAELPKFDVTLDGNRLCMIYSSKKGFEDLAEGLIMGAGKYFGDSFVIERKTLAENCTEFRITR